MLRRYVFMHNNWLVVVAIFICSFVRLFSSSCSSSFLSVSFRLRVSSGRRSFIFRRGRGDEGEERMKIIEYRAGCFERAFFFFIRFEYSKFCFPNEWKGR